MSEEETFFFRESIRHARSLPFRECLDYLRGMFEAMHEDHYAANALQSILDQLTASDAQLDLIQIGQLRLGIDHGSYKAGPRRPGKKGTQ